VTKASDAVKNWKGQSGFSDEDAMVRFGMTVKQAHAESVCIECKKPIDLDASITAVERFIALKVWRSYAQCYACHMGEGVGSQILLS